LRVEDTGVGIPEEKLPAIFERFWQADASLARAQRGAGLGTTMVKALAELMGGAVKATSKAGSGSVFEVEIPFAAESVTPAVPVPRGLQDRSVLIDAENPFEAAALADYCRYLGCRVCDARDIARGAVADPPDFVILTESASAGLEDRVKDCRRAYGHQTAVIGVLSRTRRDLPIPRLQVPFVAEDLYRTLQDASSLEHHDTKDDDAGHAVKVPSRPVGTAPRVLVVEDDPDIARLIEALLDMKGCKVQTVTDGFQALERFDDGDYDLLLVDLRMPRMDGHALAREWRAREQGSGRSRVPMIALTADTLASVREESLAVGMDDFLTKPVEPDELFRALARVVPA
jgi:CheY-like chemotaxis protein